MPQVPADRDLESIMICAFRYSLGRRTYIIHTTTDWIWTHIDCWSVDALKLILDETRKYLKDTPNEAPDVRTCWKQFAQKIEQAIELSTNPR